MNITVHKYYLIIYIIFLTFIIHGQKEHYSPIFKTLLVKQDTIKVDSFSINPRTFKIYQLNSSEYKKENYQLIPSEGKVIFYQPTNDSLRFYYHRFILNLEKKYQIHPLTLNHQLNHNYHPPISISNKSNPVDFFDGTDLNKTGSISRGLMVGNNQDFSLNSNLNLQLSGNINPEIKILASVTDNNIPIQPQGNTQQLQDFDQIFIQVFGKKWKLTTGDFWIKNHNSYFLKYHKRGQGILLNHKINKQNGYEILTENSVSISKGKFARNVIQGIEGSQGPYRLTGSENESYIIILSGTERIYIDGKLLERGQNNDYTIDYNTAEVTFTGNMLITKDKRIIIEFQYSDKNYARSLMQSSTFFKKENKSFFISVYGEQDSKNQPLQQDFDLYDRANMEQIGDEIDMAISSGIDSTNYNESINMYDKFSIHNNLAHFQLTFSDVGQGNGNYIIKEYNAMGKVYEWVAPDTIDFVGVISNGNYSPVKKLVTPKKRQVISAGGETTWKNKILNFELSSSNMDLNTFSQLDKEDNIGFAGITKLKVKNQLNENWTAYQKYSIEAVSKSYKRIERFREVEFERNWNIQQLASIDDQLISKANIELINKDNGSMSYGISSFIIKNDFSGYKNNINVKWKKIIHGDIKGSLLSSKGYTDTYFMRHKSNIFLPIKKIKLGFKDIHELNEFSFEDTLTNNSYRFYDWKVYAENNDTNKNKIQFYYQERYDWFNNNNTLKKATHIISPGVNFNLNQNKYFKANYNLAYRSLTISDTILTSIAPENSLTSRFNYQLKLFNGGIYTNSFMEIGSGLELQKEFIYLEVAAGQGVYTWNDYNENGVKELNEFEIALFSDQATYIKVYTPNNNYIKIYSFQYNQNININPKKIFDKEKIIGRLLNKLYNQTAINTHKKTNEFSLESLINPFIDADNPIIEQMSNSIRNSLFFNRSSPKYSIEYVSQLFANKNLLINGTDFRSNKTDQLKIRWNINKFFMYNTELSNELKTNNSTYAINRNYHINQQEIVNKIAYQPNTLFRLTINGRYTEKHNAIELGSETAYVTDIGIEVRRSKRNKAVINSEFHLVKINYNGQANSSIGFEMLEGLQPGSNLTWKIGFQKNMANNVQLSLNYNGRKTENNNAIHTGGVQLRAFF